MTEVNGLALLEVRKSNVYGKGCFTTEPLKKRKKFAAYAGEIIRGRRKIDKRVREQEEAGDIKIIRIGDDVAIDGMVGGDATAYINHSCEPNAFMRTAPGDKVLFFALRDIQPGEEITLDYVESYHSDDKRCACGAPNCRGTINLIKH